METNNILRLAFILILTLVGFGTAIPFIAELETRADSTTELGVAVDLCREPDFRDCQRNINIADMACYSLDKNFFSQDEDRGNGLSSIGFAGNMYCFLYTSDDCSTGKDIGHVMILKAQPDLRDAKLAEGDEEDFDNRCYSMRCHRDS